MPSRRYLIPDPEQHAIDALVRKLQATRSDATEYVVFEGRELDVEYDGLTTTTAMLDETVLARFPQARVLDQT